MTCGPWRQVPKITKAASSCNDGRSGLHIGRRRQEARAQPAAKLGVNFDEGRGLVPEAAVDTKVVRRYREEGCVDHVGDGVERFLVQKELETAIGVG